MGLRGELFSSKVLLPNRTYFFNVKENRNGDLFLNVVESKNRDAGGFERQSVIVFAEDLQEFLGGFDEALKEMEKMERERRRSPGRSRRDDDEPRGRSYDRDRGSSREDGESGGSDREKSSGGDEERGSWPRREEDSSSDSGGRFMAKSRRDLEDDF